VTLQIPSDADSDHLEATAKTAKNKLKHQIGLFRARVVAVLVSPMPSPQEVDSADAVRSVCLHVANMNAGRSNCFREFSMEQVPVA
jgi:hypothetical protein